MSVESNSTRNKKVIANFRFRFFGCFFFLLKIRFFFQRSLPSRRNIKIGPQTTATDLLATVVRTCLHFAGPFVPNPPGPNDPAVLLALLAHFRFSRSSGIRSFPSPRDDALSIYLIGFMRRSSIPPSPTAITEYTRSEQSVPHRLDRLTKTPVASVRCVYCGPIDRFHTTTAKVTKTITQTTLFLLPLIVFIIVCTTTAARRIVVRFVISYRVVDSAENWKIIFTGKYFNEHYPFNRFCTFILLLIEFDYVLNAVCQV